MAKKAPLGTLTGNQLARTISGLELALAWYRKQPSSGTFNRAEVRAYKALHKRLSDMLDFAYPYQGCASETVPPEHGAEVILRFDPFAVKKTRRVAAEFNKSNR